LGIDYRGDQPRLAITIQFRHANAAESCRLCVMVIEALPSLCSVRADGNRARTPARSIR
jgi:hypothetical protein